MLAPVRMGFVPSPITIASVRTQFASNQSLSAGMRMVHASERMQLARVGIGLVPVRVLSAPAQVGLAPARTRLTRNQAMLASPKPPPARVRTWLRFVRARPGTAPPLPGLNLHKSGSH
jgi:hypothetical protein